MHWSVQFIIKVLSVFELKFYILLNMVPVFPDKPSSWSVSWYVFLPYLHCSRSACSDCTEGSGSSTPVVSEKFLVFYFPFSQYSTIISSFFFSEIVISLIIPEVLLHFQCCNP